MKQPLGLATSFAAVMMVAAPTATTVLVPRTAHACSLVSNYEHELDATYADDATPPGSVTVTADVARLHDSGGCGAVATCGSYGFIELYVDAGDDRTPSDQIGFQVTVVGGTTPPGWNVHAGNASAVRPADPGRLVIYFDVDAPLDVQLEVRAVDLNGNVGAPATVTVKD